MSDIKVLIFISCRKVENLGNCSWCIFNFPHEAVMEFLQKNISYISRVPFTALYN